MFRRNSALKTSVESVQGLRGSLWCQRFVKGIGLESGVREWKREGVIDGESGELTEWEDVVGALTGRTETEGQTGMKLTDRTRKLIPETWGAPKTAISYTEPGWCWWSSEGNQRWRASDARRLNRDEVVEIWRLVGCEDFVSEWKEFVFDAFSFFESVKRA